MNRRQFILTATATSLAAATFARPARAAPFRIEVFKSPTCGCCSAWVDHLTRAGFDPRARDVDQNALSSMKVRAGVAPELSSCHTAFVDGYVIEGHVPAGDVKRLLADRPEALGLAVPGMPIGSPGMEMGDQRDAYDVLILFRDGSTQVFNSHA